MASDRATRNGLELVDRLGAEAARVIAASAEAALLLAPDSVPWANEEAAESLGLPLETLLTHGLPASAPGSQRLRALLAEPAAAQPSLERLRFFVGFRGVMRLAGCRRMTLRDGSAGLIVVFPAGEPDPARAETWPPALMLPALQVVTAPIPEAEALPPEAAAPAGSAASPAVAVPEPVAPLWLAKPEAHRQARRFLFSLDAEGRVLSVTPPLAETVGPASAAIEGRLLPEALRPHDEKAAETVAEALAAGETFAGIRVLWPVDGRPAFVPIDLSALPLVSMEQGLTGFSGFGHCRIDQARIDTPPAHEPATDATEPDLLASGDASVSAEPAPPPDAASESEPATDAPAATDPLSADRTGTEEAKPFSRDNDDIPELAALERVAADLKAMMRDPAEEPRRIFQNPRPPEPAADNSKVVSLRTGQPTQALPGFQRQGLSNSERNAFREIAKALGARFDEDDAGAPAEPPAPAPEMPMPEAAAAGTSAGMEGPASLAHAPANLLDRLPLGLLVLRGEEALFANRALLELTGYADLAQFRAENGARAIFRKGSRPGETGGMTDTVVLASRDGDIFPVDAHLQLLEWDNAPATLISLRRAVELEQGKALRSVVQDLRRARADITELRAILDTATDGVAILDEKGTILGLNGAAQALFGANENEMVGESITALLHRDSHAEALDYLQGIRNAASMRSVFNDGREIAGRERKGGRIPLFMTLGRISDEEPKRFCAVLRDMTAWKRAEAGLTEARQAAETANAKKSDFLAKISHEIRTPMNAIIGFADLMQEERLGPIGNAKYKEYLGDIRISGQHVVSLVNDLLDLAKIEAGRMELNFVATDLNAIVAGTVALIQPQATQSRVLVRTQLAQKLPPVVADERSIRQIVLNMLSNATRFTEAGGQVIVSTSLLATGEVTIRIRDTGIGMTATEIEQALEPFRQVGRDRTKGGTGLGLPLTKALVEANRASFGISSKPGEGTLVEITFPPTRVLAE
jgi:PAS domain S-box-containing protein